MEETHFKVLTAVLFLITLSPLLPLVVSLPTCFVNQTETSINQANHLSKEYLQSAVNTRRNMSFHRSTNPFLHPSNENSDSRFPPTFAVDEIFTPVEEAKQNTNVPGLSTLFLFLLITRAFSTFIVRIIISLQHLATITYLKEMRAWSGYYFMWEHIGDSVSLFRRRSAGCAFQAQYLPRYRECIQHCICLVFSVNHVIFLRPTMVQVRVY